MQSIQAKIDDETARQLDAVIKHTGFRTRYELLRCLVTAFLHYADREGKEGVTADQIELAQVFETMNNIVGRLRYRRPMQIDSAVYLMRQGKRGEKGVRMMTIGDGGMSSTGNSLLIVDKVMRHVFPTVYTRLMDIGRAIGAKTCKQVIEYLIQGADGMTEDELTIRTEMSDHQQSVEYGNKPVQSWKRSVNEMK